MSKQAKDRRNTLELLQDLNDYIQAKLTEGQATLYFTDFEEKPKPDIGYQVALRVLQVAEYCQREIPLIKVVENPSPHGKIRRHVEIRPRG